MPMIQLGDTSFYYECQGRGRPLVLVAGYSCDHTFWDSMYDELTKHFTVLMFDNRGIGQSVDSHSALSIESMAQDTMQLVKKLNLQEPIMLGQSMGGTIVQTIARDYGNEIHKLIILNSSMKINPRTQLVLASLLELFSEKVPFDTLIEASMTWFYSGEFLADPRNISAYKELCLHNLYPPTPELLMKQLQALKDFDANAWINKIHTPTLVIASKDDIVCLPAESRQLAEQLTNARFIEIKGGHSSPIENPSALLAEIITFSLP